MGEGKESEIAIKKRRLVGEGGLESRLSGRRGDGKVRY